jgi:glycosyltransferase involved in cell wall biosynthesis
MVLLEAMAANVPILATDCGGAPEVVGEPDQLFPLQAPERLAEHCCNHPSPLRRKTSVISRRRLSCTTISDETCARDFFALPTIQNILKTAP